MKTMTLEDAITYIALAAAIHNDPKKVVGVARVCFKKLPRARRGALAFIIGSRQPIAVAIRAHRDLLEQGVFDGAQ